MRASRFGSGPRPKGKRAAVSTKKSTASQASERWRRARRRSRAMTSRKVLTVPSPVTIPFLEGAAVPRHRVRGAEDRLDREPCGSPPPPVRHPRGAPRWRRPGGRSEEHTSELQSLMRISYAVFCLKKKKTEKQI